MAVNRCILRAALLFALLSLLAPATLLRVAILPLFLLLLALDIPDQPADMLDVACGLHVVPIDLDARSVVTLCRTKAQKRPLGIPLRDRHLPPLELHSP